MESRTSAFRQFIFSISTLVLGAVITNYLQKLTVAAGRRDRQNEENMSRTMTSCLLVASGGPRAAEARRWAGDQMSDEPKTPEFKGKSAPRVSDAFSALRAIERSLIAFQKSYRPPELAFTLRA